MFSAGVGWVLLICLGMTQAESQETPKEEKKAVERVNHGRGLLNFYDPFILGTLHLNMPLHTPHFLEEDRFEVSLLLDWGNTFARHVSQGYFIDGEVLMFHPRFRYGVNDWIEVGGELPIYSRTHGILDGLVAAFHDGIGLPDAGRSRFPLNDFEAVVTADGKLEEIHEGAGVGDLTVWSKVRLWEPTGEWPSGSFALTLRVPTGAEDFGSDGFDIGVTVTLSKSFVEWAHGYLGAGYAFYSDTREGNLLYHASNWMYFGGIEFELSDLLSMVLQSTLSSPLMRDPSNLNDHRYLVALGFLWSPWKDDRTFELGIVENLVNFEATADVSFHFGYRFTF